MAAEKAKRGLIVVDLQHAFSPPAHIVSGIRAILPKYDLIVATKFLNQMYSQFELKLKYKACQIGSPESEIVIPLNPVAVFDRFSYGLQQPHIERLRTYPVECWDICGCDTEACVLATCYNLWDGQIKFHVLKDLCHSSGGPDYQDAAFQIMQRSFGE